jgi:hypothetical protein
MRCKDLSLAGTAARSIPMANLYRLIKRKSSLPRAAVL